MEKLVGGTCSRNLSLVPSLLVTPFLSRARFSERVSGEERKGREVRIKRYEEERMGLTMGFFFFWLKLIFETATRE